MKSSSSIPDPKADGTTLRKFFREVAPAHDEERVYASDMKKIILWFNIIKELPLFTEQAATDQAEPATEEVEVIEEVAPVAEEKAKPAKKVAAKKVKKAE